MELLSQGGWMMWPLLALSVGVLTLIIERFLLYTACPFPPSDLDNLLQQALRNKDATALADSLAPIPLLRPLAELMRHPLPEHEEAALHLAGTAALEKLGARLSLLGLMARMAPLMGLLGTIVGMINTFSRLAAAQAGVDMTLLAGGIWQALLTTATGLVIAIPALLAHHCFTARRARIAAALTQVGNTALSLQAKS